MARKRILILGGGFGGVYAAVHLGKMLSREELKETEIALVNRENYIVFQPLLPEVICGTVALNHVIAPIRRMAPRASLYTRDIRSINPVARIVTLDPGIRPTTITLSYDHLVIAMGTRLDHSRIPGMREHAIPFKYLGDALYLRNQLVRMLEEAEAERDPKIRHLLLTFVVAGGGFSGVRCIAEMNEFLREAVSVYHNVAERDLRLILLQRGARILPEITASLAGFAHRLLAKRGIEIRLGADLKAINEEAVHREHFETGEKVFSSGDYGDKVYFVVKGEAAVERDGAQLAKLASGDAFGEAALISNQVRRATSLAHDDLTPAKSRT